LTRRGLNAERFRTLSRLEASPATDQDRRYTRQAAQSDTASPIRSLGFAIDDLTRLPLECVLAVDVLKKVRLFFTLTNVFWPLSFSSKWRGEKNKRDEPKERSIHGRAFITAMDMPQSKRNETRYF
jgi:hypothetical protein